MTAPHGSTRVGLRKTASTTSMHLMALDDDQTDERMQVRRPPTERAEGMANCAVSSIRGTTMAATAWVRARRSA